MSTRVRISFDTLLREAAAFERKLAQGYAALARLEEPTPDNTPRTAVFCREPTTLFRYAPTPGAGGGVPTIIVYALVNRPHMADLQSDRSLVHELGVRGVDVYLVDWGYPGASERGKSIADYLLGDLDACVDFVCRAHAVPAINLLGICQGGTFALCYAALAPDKVRNLIATVTPVDFHTEDDTLSHLLRHVDVDLMVEANGNIPGELLNTAFLSLKPFRLAQQKYVDFVEQLDDPAATALFLRMEQWIFDSPDLAGAAFREYATWFYRENRFVTGGLEIGGRKVELDSLRMPVLNIWAAADHLVPPAASRALGRLIGTKDYTELEVPGGHIGLYVGSGARSRVADTVAGWLAARAGASKEKKTP